MATDRLFRWLTLLPLLLLVGYFLILLGSQAAFFDPADFLRQLGLADIRSAALVSLATATLSTCLAMLVGIPAAYALARYDFPGKRLVDTLVDLPMVLTPIALGTLILMAWNTPVGQGLSRLGLTLPFTLAGVVAAQFTVVAAISVRLLKATFEQIEPRQEQVARLLGCTPFRCFWQVTLPLAKRGILSAVILTWARALGEFGATVMVAGTARGQTATLPGSIYLAMSVADLSRAVTLMVILISLALLVLFGLRLVTEGRR